MIAATGSDAKAAGLKELGADHVVNYRDEDRAKQVQAIAGRDGVHRIIEGSFGTNIAFDAAVLARHGVIAAFGFDDVRDQAMPHLPLMLNNAVLRYIAIFFMDDEAKAAAFNGINQAIARGNLQHQIGRTYDFDQMAQAHHDVESKSVVGAALVKVDPA